MSSQTHRNSEASDTEAGNGGEADTETAQQPVVDFLASGAWADEPPEHIVTHLSHVFLATERVLKLKRARTLPFVDFSTLEARHHTCKREITVNAPFAAPLYRGVRAITREAEGLAIDGDGAVVDYAVEMRRFQPEHQFDRMVDDGAVGPELTDALGDAIARMHAAVPAVPVDDAAARTDNVRGQVVADLADALGPGPLADRVEGWSRAAQAAIGEHAGLLDRRGRHGFVRRCHGDLHLSNICLWDGRPMPFDAIEFDEAMATIDVLYDFAFTLVGLGERGRFDLATRCLSRTLELTRDYSGLALMPLFLSQRAMVRALTRALKGIDAAPHVAQAERLMAGPPTTGMIAIGGLSGTGKTTIARALAPESGAVVIRSDTVRKRLAGVGDTDKLPASAYTDAMRTAVYRRMLVDARRALRAGWPVILDATFMEPEWRAEAEAEAATAGASFAGVWLDAPVSTLGARVSTRTGDASDADADVVRAQTRAHIGPLTWPKVDARDTPDAVAAAATEAIERQHHAGARF